MTSDVLKLINFEIASIHLGIVDGDGACDNPFTSLEEDVDELDNDETGLDQLLSTNALIETHDNPFTSLEEDAE